MKGTVLFVAIFALALLTIPMIALNFDVAPEPEMQAEVHNPVVPPQSTAPAQPAQPAVTDDAEAADDTADDEPKSQVVDTYPQSDKGVESFRILDETTGEVATVSVQDFVRGAVAAEMPVSFHIEALKAQAVAAHTFALHNHIVQQETPDPALKGADFSADPQNLKVYMTEAQARAFYGNMADTHWNKICEAADSAMSYVLEFEEEPIVAAYHAISSGQTEDASNVWTGSAPYLQATESEGDLLAPDYESFVTFADDEMRERLVSAYPDLVLEDDPQEWFGDPTRSGSGYVIEQPVGNLILHGKELRQLLDLRSHDFDIHYNDSGFHFTVYGYGHGVGLSQYGADYLARQGYSFDAILRHYYTNAVITETSAV